MPPLERAVALEEMHDVAVPVGEDLDLDVPRREHVFLDEHARVAEGAQRLALRARERGLELGRARRRGACPCRRRRPPP